MRCVKAFATERAAVVGRIILRGSNRIAKVEDKPGGPNCVLRYEHGARWPERKVYPAGGRSGPPGMRSQRSRVTDIGPWVEGGKPARRRGSCSSPSAQAPVVGSRQDGRARRASDDADPRAAVAVRVAVDGCFPDYSCTRSACASHPRRLASLTFSLSRGWCGRP